MSVFYHLHVIQKILVDMRRVVPAVCFVTDLLMTSFMSVLQLSLQIYNQKDPQICVSFPGNSTRVLYNFRRSNRIGIAGDSVTTEFKKNSVYGSTNDLHEGGNAVEKWGNCAFLARDKIPDKIPLVSMS